ncbi:pentapeptide repeat-containing protein [Dapis sp. BLCC M172]|uniref:pentapeptide repeat-containing protein n=1 Tax=Dapis sp. BLCC M172 TaxID=2975281 RepID=UPI003CEC1807
MSELESNLSALMTKVSELEKQQTTLKKYVVKLKNTLDEQIENFHHRPERQTVENLQEKLTTLSLRLDELLAVNNPVKSTAVQDKLSEEISENYQEYENQLVFDSSGIRGVLIEALSTVESRLIIVCPWFTSKGIDESLLEKFKGFLDRGCQVDIGWGYLGDGSNIGKGWKYNALTDLQELEKSYPGLFRLKLLGTHENFLVCDEKFAFVGSHNFLASGEESSEREVGIRSSDRQIIEGLIDRFDNAEFLEKAEINRRFATSMKSLDEVEYLSGVIDENEMEFQDYSMVVDEDEVEEELEKLEELEEEEESQQPVVSAEEFLRRYNEGERDFTGINLAGVDLSGKSFNDSKLNLSNANFNGANLSQVDLRSVNLTGAKFKSANLSEIKFYSANLSQAKFINTNLNKAQMNSMKL